MNVLLFLFQKLFPFWFLTPEQAEERDKVRVRTVLITMHSLGLEGITSPTLREIQMVLSENGWCMRRSELIGIIEHCIRKGYMQKLGETDPHYVLSPDGRNQLGLPGDTDG